MDQHFLVIDIGNTNQKIAIYNDAEQLLSLQQVPILTQDLLSEALTNFSIKAGIVSSVGRDNASLFDWLKTQIRLFTCCPELELPIELCYHTPNTLGPDRIANAVGANTLFPNQNVLSIQTGSCLVTDFVNAQNQYLGGTIAPGLRMRFQSLPLLTAKLPLIEPHPIDFLIGKTTEESILSGVINGYACEIDMLIQRYAEQYSPLKVVMTGGDTPMLEGKLKNSIFAAPNLVLFGLYKILRLNATEI